MSLGRAPRTESTSLIGLGQLVPIATQGQKGVLHIGQGAALTHFFLTVSREFCYIPALRKARGPVAITARVVCL